MSSGKIVMLFLGINDIMCDVPSIQLVGQGLPQPPAFAGMLFTAPRASSYIFIHLPLPKHTPELSRAMLKLYRWKTCVCAIITRLGKLLHIASIRRDASEETRLWYGLEIADHATFPLGVLRNIVASRVRRGLVECLCLSFLRKFLVPVFRVSTFSHVHGMFVVEH